MGTDTRKHEDRDEVCVDCRTYWEQETRCPTCGGAARIIGTLGLVDYYRCHDCGADISIDGLKPKGERK